MVVRLEQDDVAVSSTLLAHFFDDEYHDRPGGEASALALAAARRVVELHGGVASVEPEGHGCRVTLTIPT